MAMLARLGLDALFPGRGRKGSRPGAAPPAGQRPERVSRRREKEAMEPVAQRRRLTQRPPSFTDLLPYVAYKPDEKVFVLKDGASLGVMFELGTVPTEAQPLAYLADRAAKVQEALQAIPESDESPWVLQFFVNDDRNIDGLNDYLRDYIRDQHTAYPDRQKAILESRFTQAMLQEFRTHLSQISQPNGLFEDKLVTGQRWRGQIRRVRCCVYRRFDARVADDPSPATAQIEATAMSLQATLSEAGVDVRRCTGKDLYEWLLPFFNRKVPWAKNIAEMMRMAPYPGDDAGDGRPADEADAGQAPLMGWDLSELLNFSEPYSDLQNGVFEFDGAPVKVLTLGGLRRQPDVGHFTAELTSGKESFARFDRFPPGSMLSMSVTVRPQYLLERHIERIRDASRAKNATAYETHKECEMVLERMVHGDKLFPMLLTLYLTGNNQQEIEAATAATNALLVPTGLRFIPAREDLVPLDAFMRGLPFNYDPAFDERYLRRSRLTFASQVAALLPVYGRARGTPHPGMWFWNRGGEPLWLDPLNKHDRKKNAHMLVLGPTGAGKSATLNYQAMLTMAIHRPRLVIVDAGRSFELLAGYLKAMGLSTYTVTLTASANVSLPPFVNALRLLDDEDVMRAFHAAEAPPEEEPAEGLPDEARMDAVLGQATTLTEADAARAAAGGGAEADQAEDEEEEKRDLLGEMLIAAIMMITGGEAREEARMSRADRYLITRAIVRAAVKAKEKGRPHPLTQDIAIELINMQRDDSLSAARQLRAEDMGQSMMAFTQGLRGILFNREGQDWPEVDVTLIELGTLTLDGYEDALAVAYTSLIDSVQSRGERFQHEDRPLVFLTDEAHLITTNDLLGPKIAKGTKMWRKLNMWFWLATQNLQDFPDSMSRVLSMCELWMLLAVENDEIAQISRFRALTPEQRRLVESARKSPGQYTEGVLINGMGQFLFRNVPPALPIALAMTEGYEKAQRQRIMDERNCTELEAAQVMAQQLSAARAADKEG